ncbi:MAG: HD domain-containing phosphohydrolase [Armatimonadota bacterium]
MDEKLLVVDDDRVVRTMMERVLSRRYATVVVESGEEGWKQLQSPETFAAVISDYRMPGMNGLDFLANARRLAPETVRVMLTGDISAQLVIDAVNKGGIFSFLTKPIKPDMLLQAVDDAVAQYRRLTADRELLEKTRRENVNALCEMLALTRPIAAAQSKRVRDYVSHMVRHLKLGNAWQFEMAATLAHIGHITVPEHVFVKSLKGLPLTQNELELLQECPAVGANIVRRISQFETIAEIIAIQYYPADRCPVTGSGTHATRVRQGGQLLKAALDYDSLLLRGFTPIMALDLLEQHAGQYDPNVVTALRAVIIPSLSQESTGISINDLREGMFIVNDVYTTDGRLLLRGGVTADKAVCTRLMTYLLNNEIKDTVLVYATPPSRREKVVA